MRCAPSARRCRAGPPRSSRRPRRRSRCRRSTSGQMPWALSVRSTPIWAKPRAAPPPRASPIEGRCSVRGAVDCVVDVAVGLPSPDVQGTNSAARSGSRFLQTRANQPQNQPLIALRDRTATPPRRGHGAFGPQRVPSFMSGGVRLRNLRAAGRTARARAICRGPSVQLPAPPPGGRFMENFVSAITV